MKKILMGLGLTAVVGFLSVVPAFAAANVSAGSIGQRATDASTFGVSACNTGDATQSASVPVNVMANGVTISGQTSGTIAPGACTYTYFTYASLNMIGGNSYSVQVSVNDGPVSSYAVTVPGAVLGASAVAPDQNRINLMASEVQLMKQLISLLQANLGL